MPSQTDPGAPSRQTLFWFTKKNRCAEVTGIAVTWLYNVSCAPAGVRRRGNIACLVLLTVIGPHLFSPAAGDEDPQDPPGGTAAAELRLDVTYTRGEHAVTVPLAGIFAEREIVRVAGASSEKRLPFRPIDAGAPVPGIEIMLADAEGPEKKANGTTAGVEILLGPKGGQKKAPVAEEDETWPRIRVTDAVEVLTTRPFTPEEFMVLENRRPTEGQERWERAFDTPPSEAMTKRLKKKRRVLRRHVSFTFWQPRGKAIRFGTNRQHVAWFFFVDGKPVAYWRDAEPVGEDYMLGPAQKVSPGFHRVDLFSVAERDQEPPVPVWNRTGESEPIALSAVVSPAWPLAVRMQPGSREARGIEFQVLNTFYDCDRHRWFRQVRVTTIGSGVRLVGRGDHATGRNPGSDADTFVMPGTLLPTVRFGSVDDRVQLSSHFEWGTPMPVRATTQLLDWPLVRVAGEALSIAVEPGFSDDLRRVGAKALQLRWSQLDAEGDGIASGTVPAASGKRIALELPWRQACRTLILQPMAAGTAVGIPVELAVLHPDADFSGLRAVGRQLFRDETPVTLVCPELFDNGPAADRVNQFDGLTRLVVVDEYWADENGPGARLAPPQLLAPYLRGTVVDHMPLGNRFERGGAGHLRKFTALGRLGRMKPSIVMLTAGYEGLLAGESPRATARHLLFLCQALLRHGHVPVPVTLPVLPRVTVESVRELGLLEKEFAFRLGIPVVDLYSRLRMQEVDGSDLLGTFAAPSGGITLRTPNDAGRRRIARVLANGIATVRGRSAFPVHSP